MFQDANAPSIPHKNMKHLLTMSMLHVRATTTFTILDNFVELFYVI